MLPQAFKKNYKKIEEYSADFYIHKFQTLLVYKEYPRHELAAAFVEDKYYSFYSDMNNFDNWISKFDSFDDYFHSDLLIDFIDYFCLKIGARSDFNELKRQIPLWIFKPLIVNSLRHKLPGLDSHFPDAVQDVLLKYYEKIYDSSLWYNSGREWYNKICKSCQNKTLDYHRKNSHTDFGSDYPHDIADKDMNCLNSMTSENPANYLIMYEASLELLTERQQKILNAERDDLTNFNIAKVAETGEKTVNREKKIISEKIRKHFGKG